MIRRIQSLYLSLIVILSLIFINDSFFVFSDSSQAILKVSFQGLLKGNEGNIFVLINRLIPLSVLFILIPFLALITVFLFKNRKIQKLLAFSVILVSAGFIIMSIYYSRNIIIAYHASLIPGFKIAIPVVILILSVLAYNGIKKDDNLIKSYDRLR